MFEAEQNAKRIGLQSEDFLTSSVFGVVRHIPPNRGVLSFLRRTKHMGTGPPISLDVFGSEKLQVDWIFWDMSAEKGVGEPDIVLRLHDGSNEALVIIEVKYLSGKSGEGEERDQLMRYVEALGCFERRKHFRSRHIRQCKGELLGLVYLTKEPDLESLQRSRNHIKDPALRERLFALTWRDIHQALSEEMRHASNHWSRPFLVDLHRLLDLRRVRPFSGWSFFENADWLMQRQRRESLFLRRSEERRADSYWGWLSEMPVLNPSEGSFYHE